MCKRGRQGAPQGGSVEELLPSLARLKRRVEVAPVQGEKVVHLQGEVEGVGASPTLARMGQQVLQEELHM